MKAFHVALAARRNWRTMRHLALALVAGALAVGAAAQTDDHGDDRASATHVALYERVPGRWRAGTDGEIDPGDDEDWFRFEIPARFKVADATTSEIWVPAPGTCRPTCTITALYDANGTLLATNNDDVREWDDWLTVDAGTYYVRVASSRSATGSYYVDVGGEEAGESEEPQREDDGDDIASATPVELPSETAGEIDPGDDEDWFRFEVPARGTVTAESVGHVDTIGALHDANGNELAVNDECRLPRCYRGRGGDFTIQRTLDAGTYYVRVVSKGSTGSYVLHLHSGDHGDTLDVATQVALPSETGGEILPERDEDWFRFAVPARGELTAETSGYLVDTVGTLYDANGTLLATNDDFWNRLVGRNENFRIRQTLDAGTYYIRVTVPYCSGPGCSPPTGSYVLHLHLRSGADGDDDHGDTLAAATQVALPSETDGAFLPGDDEDWFRFEVPARGEVAIETSGDLDTFGTLYDAYDNVVTTSDNAEIDQNLNFRIWRTLDAGTYYLRVVSYWESPGSYVLHLVAGEVAGEDDHGDTLAAATQVALPSDTDGEIYYGDVDWFRFEVPARGEVAIETSGDMDTIGTLYDANGTYLDYNDDSAGNQNFLIRRTLDAGTYYLEVLARESSAGSYVLHLRSGASGDDDHADTLAAATQVALPSETEGEISPGYDEDWFRFDVLASATVTAETSGDLWTEGALHDANGTLLASDYDSGARYKRFRIRRTLDAGTYYLRVTSKWRTPGSYVLHLRGCGASAVGRLRTLGDFNGDGKDDVLLRHADGRWHYYPMDGANVIAGGGPASLTQDRAWRIAGVGDFDGDGKDDVLLRHAYGRWHYYPMDGANVLPGSGPADLTQSCAWQLAGIADFDGDGKDDVLLRHENGRWYYYYQMNGRRALAGSGQASLPASVRLGGSDLPIQYWQIAGVGDFDGDGRADVLLRTEPGYGDFCTFQRWPVCWHIYYMNGRAPISDGVGMGAFDPARRVAGVGDFDGDGRDDVLFRHTDGRWNYHYRRRSGVGEVIGSDDVDLTDDTSTTVAGIGDMNGDGRADVLARGADGGWHYYALDGGRMLSVSGAVALTSDLAWGVLYGGRAAIGTPTTGTPLPPATLAVGQDEAFDISEAFVDDQTLTYQARSSAPDVVRTSLAGDVLTLMPVAEGTATVSVTARDPDGNAATQTIAVTVGVRDCAECPLMVRIPAGTFTMGSPRGESGRFGDEGPRRTVSIPAFASSAHEVTFAEWDACAAAGGCGGYRPDDKGWGRGDRPVFNVSWDDVQSYVDWLSHTSGHRYRLLTESEWEYAARAGTRTPFHTGETITPQQANFDGRYDYPANEYDESGLDRGQTVPVGSFAPNGFGLYDMHGNVWEWVQDCYVYGYAAAPSDGSAVQSDDCMRVVRGGNFNGKPRHIRSANRFRHDDAGTQPGYVGFRVARTR